MKWKYEVKVAILSAIGVVVGTIFVLWASSEDTSIKVDKPLTIILLEKELK